MSATAHYIIEAVSEDGENFVHEPIGPEIHGNLKVACEYADAGCKDLLFLQKFDDHLTTCPYKDKKVTSTRCVPVRKPLHEVDKAYAKSKRLLSK